MDNADTHKMAQQVFENYLASYRGTVLIADFCDKRLMPALLEYCGHPLLDAVIGLMQRINFWLLSLRRLDHAYDFQAVISGARSIYEIFIDIRILCIENEDPVMVEKYHFHPDAARFEAAVKYISAIDKHTKDESEHGGVDSRRAIANDSRIKAEYDIQVPRLWGKKKVPHHWTGLSLPERIEKYLTPDNMIEYRDMYSQFSWHVHSGSAGMKGMTNEAIAFMYFHAHVYIHTYVNHAITFCGMISGLFDKRPELKQEWEKLQGEISTTIDKLAEPA